MGIDGTVNARELGGLSLSDKRNSVCKNKKDPLATNRDFDQKDSFIPFVNEGSFSIENNIKYRDEQGDLLCSTTIVKEKETETIVKPKNSLQEVKSLDWNKFYKDFNNNSAKETNKDISNLFALQGLTDKEVLNNLVSKYEKYLLPIKYTLHKNSTLSEASYKVELEITDTDINFKDLNNCPTVLFGDTLEGSFTFENEGVIYKGLISDKNFFLYKATDNSILNVVDSTTWNAFKASYGLSFTKDSTDNRVYTLRNGNLSFKLRLEEATEKGFKLKVISYSNIPSTSFKYTSLFETIGKTFNCTYQEVAFCNSYSLRKLNEDKRFTKVFNNFNTLILEELAPSGSSKLFRFDSFNFEGKVILTTSKGFLGSILFEYSLTGATLFTIEALTLEDWENFDLYKKRIINSFGKAQSFDKVFILTMSREANPQFESENISVEENKIVYSLENCNPLKDFKSSVNYSTADFSLKTIQEHPIYSFIEFPDKKDLLIKSNSKESSLNSYTNLTPMPFDFGGLNKGTTFENEAISSLLDKLLYANISPKSYLTFFDETNALIDSNLINKGKTKQIKKIQVRVEKGSDFVHKVYVYQDLGNNLSKLVGSVLFQKDDYNLESVVKEIVLDTPLTISEEETFFTNVETLLFKDFDSYGDILDDAVPIPNNRNTSFSFKFIEPKFYGYMTVEEVTELRNDTWDWTTINKTYIDASDKEIITLSYSSPDLEFEEDSIQIKEGSSDEISVSYFLAVPKTFTVEKALDENGFDITDSFSMYERLNMNIYTLDFYNVLKDYNIVFKLKGGN